LEGEVRKMICITYQKRKKKNDLHAICIKASKSQPYSAIISTQLRKNKNKFGWNDEEIYVVYLIHWNKLSMDIIHLIRFGGDGRCPFICFLLFSVVGEKLSVFCR
jgi:spore coat polysaccharide biosynthesis protein SpsF (cytidylyltransferase family)